MKKLLFKLFLFICVSLGSHVVQAGPVRCSVNNQDSSCLTPISTTWQTAPTCPASAGWTTITPAKWIGSQYSAPQCNYQAPPSCPPGYDQNAAPTWNGSSWVGQVCIPSAPPPPPATSLCQAAVPAGYTITSGTFGPDPLSLVTRNAASWAGFTPDPSDVIYSWMAKGPVYDVPCPGQDNTSWGLFCYVRGSGSLDFIFASHTTPTGGACNH